MLYDPISFPKKGYMVKVDPFTMYMDVLIHIQGALMDEVLPNLRAVRIGFKNNTVTLYCLFYGDCSEKDVDDMSCVETEASCHYLDGEMNFLCVRNCENKPLHTIGDMFAFIRKDTRISLNKNEILHPIVYLRSHPTDPSFPFPSRRLHILISIQHALFGAVDPNLRLVSIEWTDTTITAYFIFDKEVSESNLQSMKTVQDEMSKDFPKDEIHIQEIHCDYPQRALLPEETMVVYARKENREV